MKVVEQILFSPEEAHLYHQFIDLLNDIYEFTNDEDVKSLCLDVLDKLNELDNSLELE